MFPETLLKSTLTKYRNSLDSPQKHSDSENLDGGFSLVEVLVTILVITGFLLGALQATVLAALLRVQAQDKQDATNFVQQDLELIRFEAFQLEGTDSSGNATTGSDATECTADTYGSALQTALATNFPATQSNVSINNKGYDINRTYTANGNTLEVVYQVAYSSTHPRYKGTNNDNTVAELSTEVLPDAALNCP